MFSGQTVKNNTMRCILIFLLASLINSSFQRSTPQDDHYIAAVVEYEVTRDVDYNKAKYAELIAEAAQQNADIVVFPELTLTNSSVNFIVPINGALKENPIPALHPDLYDDVLVAMSVAAREHSIYVVFNGQEEVDCTNNIAGEECPEAKVYYFNTNVVMDRTGAVIDRYRKINLFGEFSRTPALQPDLGVFTTDFGVTFGHFVCFDIMFQVPAIQVVQKHQLTDVIFTTMWFSELPYLTAVQIQEAYAYALNVNFLGSGANQPAVGSAGSGIFSGKAGALVSIMPGVSTTRLLVAKVPKVPGQVTDPIPGPIYDDPATHDGLLLITDPSLPSHISRLLVDGAQEFVLVDKDVSCTFRVKLTQASGSQTPKYRAVIYDGSNIYARRGVGVSTCGLVACKDDRVTSCTYRFDPKTIKSGIQELEIKMSTYRHQYNETLKCDNVLYFPMSLQANKFPLSSDNISYVDVGPNGKEFNHQDELNTLNEIPQGGKNQHKMSTYSAIENDNIVSDEIKTLNGNIRSRSTGREHVTFKINKPQDGLIAFGIFGRIFTRDVDHRKKITKEDVEKFKTLMDKIYGHYTYRAAAFSGVRTYSGFATGGTRICSIVACIGDTMDTCGRRFNTYAAGATAVFEELSILAAFPTPAEDPALNADDSTILPVALKTSIMPLEPEAYSYDVITEGRLTYANLTLNSFHDELYSFAVWGRVFATDGQEADPPVVEEPLEPTEPGQENTPDAASSLVFNAVLVMALMMMTLVL